MTLRISALNGESKTQDYDLVQYENRSLTVGVGAPNDLLVEEQTVPDSTVKVAAGIVALEVIRVIDSKTFKLFCESNGSANVTVTGLAGNIGAVIAAVPKAKIEDGSTNPEDGTGVFELIYVEGTGLTPLTDGDIDTETGNLYYWYRLADIEQAATITTAEITDTRSMISVTNIENITVRTNVTSNEMNTDSIYERTLNAGVTIEDVQLIDGYEILPELGADTSTPAANFWTLYFKGDGAYIMTDDGIPIKLSTGGATTQAIAEAGAINGEIFENTDWFNNLSWKDSGALVHRIVDKAMIEAQAGTVNISQNAGVAGAFSFSGNGDIAVAPFISSGKYLARVVYQIYVYVDQNPGTGFTSTPYHIVDTFLFDNGVISGLVREQIGRTGVSTTLFQSPFFEVGTTGQAGNNPTANDLWSSIVASVNGYGTSGTFTINTPVFSGTNFRFPWTFTGTVSLANFTVANATIALSLYKLTD